MKKFTALLLALAMLLTLAACGGNTEETAAGEPAAIEEEAPEEEPVAVTVEADGREIAIEDAAGMTPQELLDAAGITLNEGDQITVDLNSALGGGQTIRVLRRCTVEVTVTGDEETPDQVSVAVLYGGTVQDALDLLKIELTEDMTMDCDPADALTDGMKITITAAAAETEEEAEEEAEAETPVQNDNAASGAVTPAQNTNAASGTAADAASDTGSSEDGGSTSNDAESSERQVVQVIDNGYCDDSGHGEQITIYSDGTSEITYY